MQNNLYNLLAERLLERLPLFRLEPQVIVNIGAVAAQRLQQHYRQAQIHEFNLTQNLNSFGTNSVDMIFSHLALNAVVQDPQIWQELQRILRPEGLLLFTILGRDTLQELGDYTQYFVDMHDVGDQLTQANYVDPVMDVEYLTIKYQSLDVLQNDFKQMGVDHFEIDLSVIESLRDETGKFSVTLELIYGHAFGSIKTQSFVNDNGEVVIPLHAISRG